MATPRIFTTEALAAQTRVRLAGQPGHHLARVLRRKAGDPVILFDGSGGEYEAQIATIDRNVVELEVLNFKEGNRESPLQTDMGLVISKGDRMVLAIQKATELGLSRLTPLFSDYCDIKLPPDRIEKKLQHWRQIAISASEQCGRNCPPEICQPQQLAEWITQDSADLSLVFSPGGQALNTWSDIRPRSVRFLIGPEGGLSVEELEQLRRTKFNRVELGPRILRTETAPIVVLSLIQYLWGDI